MSGSIETALAIEAFRKHERARRNFLRSEDELHNAVRMVPSKHMDRYFLSTEIIRLEEEMREARIAKDREAEMWCGGKIIELQQILQERQP